MTQTLHRHISGFDQLKTSFDVWSVRFLIQFVADMRQVFLLIFKAFLCLRYAAQKAFGQLSEVWPAYTLYYIKHLPNTLYKTTRVFHFG